MMHKTMTTVAVVTILALAFLVLPGCPKSPCPGLQNGKVYEVELQDGEVLYALEIELEGDDDGDNDECEQEGEHEGENDPCDGEGGDDDGDEASISAQVTDIAADRSTFQLLGSLTVMLESGAEVEIPIETLEVGTWVEVEGALGTDGLFHAEELDAADEHEIELQGVLQDLTETSFTMLGLTITYDDNTEQECEDDDEGEHDDDDDDDEEDDD